MPQHPLALSDAMRSTLLRNKPNGDFLGNKAHSANFGLFMYVFWDYFLFFLIFLSLFLYFLFYFFFEFILNTNNSDRGLANAKPGDANDLTSYNPVNLTVSDPPRFPRFICFSRHHRFLTLVPLLIISRVL